MAPSLSRSGAPLAPRLASVFAEVPVVASVIGTEPLRQFLTAPAKVCILASFTVGQLPKVVPALVRAGKTVFVNVDSSPGLAQDRGALDYIKSLGTHGVVSTRLSLIEKGRPLGLLTMMKVFVTDRSNLSRSMDAISRGAPDLVEIMPAPIIGRMTARAQRAMSPSVAAGFVETPADVALALALGSVAAATSDSRLWHLRRDQLPPVPPSALKRPAAPSQE
ncbi:glycerol-3-phosphate responsive antiterminator [Streptomyces sp. NEAU-YJ-81]|uniref:glycerol-3-phosphate responsive antiterminator n=1 Tax=Streptomyces sp. NEAU-YJ-81 TaxID=2820288 RepID=UPI001ABD2809|nr:glycerol-3-phosphate responsive antiterminator [Streptomyces sp. NEAU-YJ-81]MBO3681348.1 glycerol-3-phosphate responsive antiterminator [Streptomyces sp. NEAU-YJ-81]